MLTNVLMNILPYNVLCTLLCTLPHTTLNPPAQCTVRYTVHKNAQNWLKSWPLFSGILPTQLYNAPFTVHCSIHLNAHITVLYTVHFTLPYILNCTVFL